jgi:hypothetical protein
MSIWSIIGERQKNPARFRQNFMDHKYRYTKEQREEIFKSGRLRWKIEILGF